ncbi:MAG: hypothetical protein JWN72_2836 [Thermoleophilia bacterium]|nr:hypothetical protein [Thermoleophilia bacterium]
MTAADAGTGEGPERTPDGHHIVVGGRKWRASDPAIPDSFRSELVHELMDARRAVGAGTRAGDEEAVTRARARVHDAKVALGERGVPWWEPRSGELLAERLGSAMRALLRHRAPTSTICPSDAARVAGGAEWRTHMELARDVAFRLQADDVVEVRAAGERVPARDEAHGPLRIARASRFPE